LYSFVCYFLVDVLLPVGLAKVPSGVLMLNPVPAFGIGFF